MLRGLYAITDPHLTPTATLLHQVQAAVRGGAQVIQYRDKSSPAPLRLQMAQQLRALTRELYAEGRVLGSRTRLNCQLPFFTAGRSPRLLMVRRVD